MIPRCRDELVSLSQSEHILKQSYFHKKAFLDRGGGSSLFTLLALQNAKHSKAQQMHLHPPRGDSATALYRFSTEIDKLNLFAGALSTELCTFRLESSRKKTPSSRSNEICHLYLVFSTLTLPMTTTSSKKSMLPLVRCCYDNPSKQTCFYLWV